MAQGDTLKLEYSVEKPLNREPELATLVESFITTNGYDRNHGPIPYLDPQSHRVALTGLVRRPLSLSVADLAALPQHHVVCALQCAGNRRHTMRTKLKEVHGIDWLDGAVMNCKWTGPLLADVLAQGGGVDLAPEQQPDAHVAFSCFQTQTQDDSFYGASLPLARALDPNAAILLALRMNDAPLPAKHGAPVRVVTPGIAGARCVKWLDEVCVQMGESKNYYQQHDYKILPPEADTKEKAEAWWGKVAALHDMPINSVIGVPRSHATVARDAHGRIEVKGYALPSGAHGPVVRVEVSADQGRSWHDAELHKAYQGEGEGEDENAHEVELKWAWALWKAHIKVAKGTGVKLWSRATDRQGNTQQQTCVWNFRGVGYNAYGEVEGLEIV